MEKFSEFNQVQSTLNSAQTIFIILPQKLSQDKVAAALSLYLSLVKTGKDSSCYCSPPMTVEYSGLIGVDKIAPKIEGRNLVISFDYAKDSVEKVSYNIENDKFNLVIQPKEGFSPLSTKKMRYSYSGSKADLLIIIGASSPEDLGEIYFENKDLFNNEKSISIDIHPSQSQFTKMGFIDQDAASYSEVIASLLVQLRMPVDSDMATNLLMGIEEATGKFSSAKVNARTFEAAAFCLRAGARWRQKKAKSPLKPMPTEISAEKPPTPPADWFEPKIYKGNTHL